MNRDTQAKSVKRRIITIVVTLVALVVIAAIAMQVVLMTDLPRRLIVEAVAQKTGLAMHFESISIRWDGRTTVRQAEVTAPLDSEPFFAVETIELRHHSLPILLLTRSLGLKSVRVVQPELSLWQSEQGRWNVQNVADHLAALPSEPSQSGSASVSLPDVEVEAASIRIAEPNGPSRTIGPIQFSGVVENGSVWRFALTMLDGIDLSGELVEGGSWAHRVQFDVAPTVALQESLLGQAVANLRIVGRWDGRLETGNLRGTLRFTQLRAGPASVDGAMDIAMQNEGLIITPESLVLNEPNLGGEPLRMAGGKIRLGAAELTLDGVRLQTGIGAAQIKGQWDIDTQAGAVTATWAGRVPGRDSEYKGIIQAELRSPPHGLKQASFTASAEAQSNTGTWRMALETIAFGREWDQSVWKATLHEFSWKDDRREIDLDGTTAEVVLEVPQARLTRLTLPRGANVTTRSQLNWETGQWMLQLDTTGLRLSESERTGWNIRLHGAGDSHHATIEELRIAEGSRSLTGQGQISFETHEVRGAHLSAQWPDRAPSGKNGPAQNRGRWTAEIDVTGMVQPLALETDVALRGQDVRLGKRQVAQLEIPLKAQVGTERVTIATTPFTLLGGRWQFSGRHEFVHPETQLDLTIENLSLRNAAEMAGSPVQSRGLAHAQLQVTMPNFDFNKTLAYGRWEVTDLSIAPLEAASAQGQIRIAGGLVQCDEIKLVQDEGRAEGALRFRLDQPQQLHVTVTSTDWPTQLKGQPFVLLSDGSIEAQVDLQSQSIEGKGTLAGRFLMGDDQFGRVDTTVQIAGRTLTIDTLRGTLLGGSLEGNARIPLDQLAASAAKLQWHDIHPDQLAPWLPQASRAGGTISGSLVAYQADEAERPLGPLRIDVQSQIVDGHFGAAQVQDANIVAYLSAERFLIDRCRLQLFGGQINGRGRLSPHAGQIYLAVSADVNNLDLRQIAHMADPNAAAVVGRLSGTGTLMTSDDWQRLSGQANLKITESNLGNNPIIRTLYDVLSLDLGPSKAEGTGSADLLFSGTRVQIPSFVYFNRGVEVRGAVAIKDLALGAESPIDGYAFGSTRVLKGTQLPGVKQLDKLMSSLQNSMASVMIGGTMGQTKVNVVPLPVVGDALRGLLWNQLREEEK